MSGFPPTPEQQRAIDAALTGRNVVIKAGAGAGKTTTLAGIAAAQPNRRGVYFAFNKAIALDAAKRFPNNVQCSTLHSLAHRAVMTPNLSRRKDLPYLRGMQLARALGVPMGPWRVNDLVVLAPQQIARLAMETVTRYCNSADTDLAGHHVPKPESVMPGMEHRALAAHVLPFAKAAWVNVSGPGTNLPGGAVLKVQHDHYLKVWALRNPVLGADYLLLDEAQDSNGVTMSIVKANQDAGAQIITVGDSNQAIYEWRGAVDAMDAFGADLTVYLTKSFRFGQAVADEANKWLDVLDADLRIEGFEGRQSRIGDLHSVGTPRPNAVLCRTNARAVQYVMDYQGEGVKAALVGGGEATIRLAEAAQMLQREGRCFHPELSAFSSWADVVDFAENDFGGQDLAVAVKLIDTHGPDAVIAAMKNLRNERDADVVVSTAHKSKGREWDEVLIADDFREPKADDDGEQGSIVAGEARLAYVAVTRAQNVLDPLGVDWTDRWVPAGPVRRPRPTPVADRKPVTCGIEHSGYLNVTCVLPLHGDDTDHHDGQRITWGAQYARVPSAVA